MRIAPGQKTTHLQTGLKFSIVDMRGKMGFPNNGRGLAFQHHEERIIFCKWTGVPIKRNARYVIRSDDSRRWRIDLMSPIGPLEAVYDPDRNDHWDSATDAAAALVRALHEIATESSLSPMMSGRI